MGPDPYYVEGQFVSYSSIAFAGGRSSKRDVTGRSEGGLTSPQGSQIGQINPAGFKMKDRAAEVRTIYECN